MSEIRTNLFGFQTLLEPNRDSNGRMARCLKSERVRISDIYCKRLEIYKIVILLNFEKLGEGMLPDVEVRGG